METTAISVKNALGEEFIDIQHEEAYQGLYACWRGEVTVEDVKQGAEKVLEQVQAHGCINLLNDNRDLTGSWDGANEWIEKDWMPRVVGAGLQKFAHMVSADIFAAMSVEEMATRVSGFEMRIFEDEQEARAWLQS